jgi:2-oxo-4-hydroxy-4-carboxy-5-ureidoimidazoline decarboxylase
VSAESPHSESHAFLSIYVPKQSGGKHTATRLGAVVAAPDGPEPGICDDPAPPTWWLTSYDHVMASELAQLNDAPPADAQRALTACCASPVWVAAMLAARPYPDIERLCERGRAEVATLDWTEVRVALDAHPRIGARVAGTGAEAAWSRQEQAGLRTASEETRAALFDANRDYEERFGHVFLIFATGRTDTEMLAAARSRLGNSEADEQAVVRVELGRIVDLRLRRLAGAKA